LQDDWRLMSCNRFEILSWNFPEGTEEKYEKPRPGQPVSRSRFELSISRTQVQSVTATITGSVSSVTRTLLPDVRQRWQTRQGQVVISLVATTLAWYSKGPRVRAQSSPLILNKYRTQYADNQLTDGKNIFHLFILGLSVTLSIDKTGQHPTKWQSCGRGLSWHLPWGT
jgi:hypothetical protein